MITMVFLLTTMAQTQPSTNCEALAARVAMLEAQLATQARAIPPPPAPAQQATPHASCYATQATPQVVYAQPAPAITYTPPPVYTPQQAPQASCYAAPPAPAVTYVAPAPMVYSQQVQCIPGQGYSPAGRSIGGIDIGGMGGMGAFSRGVDVERRGIFGRSSFSRRLDGLGSTRSVFERRGILGGFHRAEAYSCGPLGCP